MRLLLLALLLSPAIAMAKSAADLREREIKLKPGMILAVPSASWRAATLDGIPPITGGTATFRFVCNSSGGCIPLRPGEPVAGDRTGRFKIIEDWVSRCAAIEAGEVQATAAERLQVVASRRLEAYRFKHAAKAEDFFTQVFVIDETISEAERGPAVPPPDVKLSELVWAARPEDPADYYPTRGERLGVMSTVALSCLVGPDLRPFCKAAGTIPSTVPRNDKALSRAFIIAAFRMMSDYRAAKILADGRPAAGRSFTTRIVFDLPR